MNKLIKGIGIVALLLLVGQGCVNQANPQVNKNGDDAMMEETSMKKDDAMVKSDDSMTKDDSMMEEDKAMEGEKMSKGSYEQYAPEKLALANSGDVVLFFHASWCPTCKALNDDITKNLSQIPAGLTILKTDYDTETELKKKYGVTYQHTLVQVDAKGNMINKWSGGATLDTIVSKVK